MPRYILTKIYSAVALLLVPVAICLGQALPPIQNFTTNDYKAQNQNWSITQDVDKKIYVANNEGLLEYNGAKWNLYSSPNETIMRSVQVIEDKIYTGCYREFGYWERDSYGVLKYRSLTKQLQIDHKEDEEIWKILPFEDWIIFQSLQRIYIYEPATQSVRIIDSSQEIINMFQVKSSLYYQERNRGLNRIVNGQPTLIADQAILKQDEIVNMVGNEQGYLILTRHNGFFQLTDQQFVPWSEANEQLRPFSIYSSITNSDGDYILGTISNGIILLSKEGSIKQHYRQANGLMNNTVLSIFEDADRNFWAGLDHGISLININAPISIYRDLSGTLGSVYSTVVFEDHLYAGTNQGLFYKPISNNTPFRFIPDTEGQVWSLKVIDGTLFCGHHKGTFIVNNQQAQLISDVQGTWDLFQLDQNRILQGNYDGLYVLAKASNSWRLKNKLEGFNNSSRHFVSNGNELFVNHEYKGLFHLQVNQDFTRVDNISIDTVLKSANSDITSYNEQIYYGYKNGVARYNQQTKSFDQDTLLSRQFDESTFLSGSIVRSGRTGEFWLFNRENLIRVSFDNLIDRPKIIMVPLSYETRQEVTEFENVIHLHEETYLIGTSFGYITINLNELNKEDFVIQLGTISNGINPDHSLTSNLIDIQETNSFKNNENNLSFNFHTSSFHNCFNTLYQYRLVDLYDQWSEWSTSSSVFYENLPPGSYEFNVRSRIGNKLSQNVASYKFSVARPWYATNIMLVIYLVGLIGVSFSVHGIYRGYYKRQQQILIENNQRELELAKLQSEKEIMELKNEQLEKENKSKSNELAASTMSIIKKNELLNQIKEQLAQTGSSNSVRPVIKTIDKNLNQRKNWELFQEAFNNADREFFKKITDAHPDLSPNDLKLCAYLRLNLSSKEIAGLINISPRSVEVKRYRLRKKLKLDNNENLANYIIGI